MNIHGNIDEYQHKMSLAQRFNEAYNILSESNFFRLTFTSAKTGKAISISSDEMKGIVSVIKGMLCDERDIYRSEAEEKMNLIKFQIKELGGGRI